MEQKQKSNPGQAESASIWCATTIFCLALLPAAGQLLAARIATPLLSALGACVSAVILTKILLVLLPPEGGWGRLFHPITSVAALVLLPVFGVTESLLPAAAAPEGTSPALIAFCWIAGVILACLARAVRQVLTWQAVETSTALIHPIHLFFSVAVFAVGFWLIAMLILPQSTTPFALEPVLLSACLALFSLTVSLVFSLGITIARDRKEMAPSDLAPLFLTAVAMLVYGFFAGDATTSSAQSGYLTVMLVLALLSVFLIRRFIALAFAGTILTLSVPLLCQLLLAEPMGNPGLLALLVAIPFSIMRTSRRSGGNLVRRAGDPPPAVLANFNRASTSWLVLLDLEKRSVHFPHGSVFTPERGPPIGFNRVFQENGSSGLLDLLRELQKKPGEATQPVRIRLQMKSTGEAKRPPGAPQLFEARILENNHPHAWLALFSLSHEKELAQRAENAEKLLADAVLREERLLSFAAHELRTPIAILSMLAEELRSGSLWEDVRESFDQTMERITSILEDLRADSGASSGPVAGQSFTPTELIAQLLEIFAPVATTHGITIEASRAEQSDLPLKGDFGRIFIALSKLIHNAIIHSRATTIRLSVIVSRGTGQDVSLTWQVSDNGIGIPEHERARIFEPFETDASDQRIGAGTGRAGLGLYTARKAINLLGGELNLLESRQGSHFVLSHPVRSADIVAGSSEEGPGDVVRSEISGAPPLWFGRRALLIEDNRLVGEITRTRLRRLFQQVDWAETGPAGLEMWQRGSYDLILVDQLLPGLTGCEIVREIREVDSKVPIIGITASTLGSECRELEAAGVTLALEKPLSYAQIRGLAEEWFPSAVAGE